MAQNITERVRLSVAEERKLQQIAKRTNRSKSEVLRAGLEAQWAQLEAERERREAFEGLIQMAKEIPGGPKLHMRMKH